MKIQIAIVIYHLIKEICTEFLCKKHNVLPACRGHALPEGSILPSGGRFPGVSGAGRGQPREHFPRNPGGSLAFLGKAGIMVA